MEHVITDAVSGEVTVVQFTVKEIEEATKALTAEAIVSLRQERNRLLALSDWTQVADAPVDKVAWATYRQALRDLPRNTSDPINVVWPTPPV